jgi:hypothetical protein
MKTVHLRLGFFWAMPIYLRKSYAFPKGTLYLFAAMPPHYARVGGTAAKHTFLPDGKAELFRK